MRYEPRSLDPKYEARPPLREDGWNYIKMVVSGRRMKVFVNAFAAPTNIGLIAGDILTEQIELSSQTKSASYRYQ